MRTTAQRLRDKRLYWRGGAIWCRVLGPAGRIVRKSTKCRDEQAAVARANEYERVAADPRHAAASQTAISGSILAYIADLRRRRRAAATIEIAEQKTGHLNRLWGKDLPMLRITGPLVLEYIDARQRETASDFTIKKELGHLGQVLRIAKFAGTFAGDIETVIPPYFSGKHVPRKRYPTFEESQKLIETLTTARGAHVAYILATGARLAESFRAMRDDAAFALRTVQMHGSKTALSSSPVPITPLTEGLLRWSLEHAPGRAKLFLPWGKIHRDLEAACVRAGIAKVTPNDLRRAFATWHQQAGIDDAAVARMLRHTTDKLVKSTYGQIDGAGVSKLVNGTLRGVPILFLGGGEKAGSEGVSKMYLDTAPTAQIDREPHDEPAEKSRAPGSDRNYDLRFRKPLATLGRKNARSVGNQLAWDRRRAAAESAAVPVLYPPPWPFSPGRLFRVPRAGDRRPVQIGGPA